MAAFRLDRQRLLASDGFEALADRELSHRDLGGGLGGYLAGESEAAVIANLLAYAASEGALRAPLPQLGVCAHAVAADPEAEPLLLLWVCDQRSALRFASEPLRCEEVHPIFTDSCAVFGASALCEIIESLLRVADATLARVGQAAALAAAAQAPQDPTTPPPSPAELAASAIANIEAVEPNVAGEDSDRLGSAGEDVLSLLAWIDPEAAERLENA